MPSIPIHTLSTNQPTTASLHAPNLPALLSTPSGTCIIEIQGSLNLPDPPSDLAEQSTASSLSAPLSIDVGQLSFPHLEGRDPAEAMAEGAWMKKVYLHVGQRQRLVGEVRKLEKPLAVLRRRLRDDGEGGRVEVEVEGEELEIADVVRWKIVFQGRPEFI